MIPIAPRKSRGSPDCPLSRCIYSAANSPESPPRSLQPESRGKRWKGGNMGNADKNARETARFLDNLTEFIAGEEQQLDEIMDSLRAQGVDPEESLRQFRQVLSEHAPTWREKAA